MGYLLDTHILLWYLYNDPKLSGVHKDIIENESSSISVSYVSLWEISIKKSLGKLVLNGTVTELKRELVNDAIDLINITIGDLEHLGRLPYHHRDPFDRLLISQAATREMTLITADEQIQAYGGIISVL